MSRHQTQLCPTKPRRGLVSVAMLVGLIILGLVVGSLLKVGLARRSLAKMEEQRLQLEALADSGVGRALARLGADPRYEGEVWEISKQDLDDRGTARIALTVKPDPDRPGAKLLMVVAEYRVEPLGPIRQTRTLRLPPITPA